MFFICKVWIKCIEPLPRLLNQVNKNGSVLTYYKLHFKNFVLNANRFWWHLGSPSSQKPDWLGQGQSPSWLPGRARTTGEVTVTSQTIADISNTRSSFGRGISWQPSTSPPSTPSTKSWRVTGAYSPTQTPWYPSRNNEQMMMDNAIDEPNQQGLESASATMSISSTLVVLSTILLVYPR